MDLVFQRRAEIAFRSLNPAEKKRVTRSLDALLNLEPKEALSSSKLHKMVTPSDTKLYIYQGSQRLRVIISLRDTSWVIEDIVDHDRLARLLSSWGQP